MVLLAAVVVDKKLRERYLRTTSADMFYGTGHAALWRTLQDLDRRGLDYDPMTMQQLGGPELPVDHLENLIQQRPIAPPNIRHHVGMLHWDHARVMTAKGPLTRMLEMLKDPRTDEGSLRSAAKQVLDGLSSGKSRTLRNPRQLVDEHMAVVRARRTERSTWGFGIPTLDYYEDGEPRLVPGTAPGMVTCVTGASGGAKTTATARGVLGLFEQGRRIAYGAYEQGSGMSLELLAVMSLGLSRNDMMIGRFDDQNEQELEAEMRRISESVLFDEIPFEQFATRQGNPNERAIDRMAQAIIDSRCEVYVADLFERQIEDSDPGEEKRALFRIQHLAEALRVHVILVQQQNVKKLESSKSKLPTREAIQGHGAWVQVSDQILGWHLPALWKNVPNDRAYCLVLKQRHGVAPLMVEFDYDSEFALLENGRSVEMQREGDIEQGDDFDSFWGVKDPGLKPK